MNKKIDNILTIKNLTFNYPGAKDKSRQLQNINMIFKRGKWISILGPNGAGKSTLAKLIVRILPFKDGEISLENEDIKKYKSKTFAQQVAYIPQYLDIPLGTSVYDFVAFGRNPYLGLTGRLSQKDRMIISRAMKITNIEDWANKTIDKLSGGERQKVLFAMILVQDAKIILLDEATTFLDIRNQYELLEMLHHEHVRGKTIITILHNINQAVQYSDYIYLMKSGKIVEHGDPGKVINQKTLEDVFAVRAELYRDNQRNYLTGVKLIDFKYGSAKIFEHQHQQKNEVKVKKNKSD